MQTTVEKWRGRPATLIAGRSGWTWGNTADYYIFYIQQSSYCVQIYSTDSALLNPCDMTCISLASRFLGCHDATDTKVTGDNGYKVKCTRRRSSDTAVTGKCRAKKVDFMQRSLRHTPLKVVFLSHAAHSCSLQSREIRLPAEPMLPSDSSVKFLHTSWNVTSIQVILVEKNLEKFKFIFVTSWQIPKKLSSDGITKRRAKVVHKVFNSVTAVTVN